MANYHLRFYWYARRESFDERVDRLLDLLDRLRSRSKVLDHWELVSETGIQPFEESVKFIHKLLVKSANYISAGNRPEEACSMVQLLNQYFLLTFACGETEDSVSNRILLEPTGKTFSPNSKFTFLSNLANEIAEACNPSFGVILTLDFENSMLPLYPSPRGNELDAGWMVYLQNDQINDHFSIPKYVDSAFGKLFYCTEDNFDDKNELHRKLAVEMWKELKIIYRAS